MLSAYFKIKTKTNDFTNHLEEIINTNKDKRVLLYGLNDGFVQLNKKYDITQRLNIIAIVDENLPSGKTSAFCGINSISKEDIFKEQYDVVVVTNERSVNVICMLENEFSVQHDNIFPLFIETIKDEVDNINFLYKNKFDKTYSKLVKKMNNKKVVLYGAGVFLETINKYFDLSKLNIIGIADKKFCKNEFDETFLGYKTYNPNEIKDLEPDSVLISTKFYINVFEDLYYNLFNGTKIKVKPLVKKSFWTLLNEIF